MLVTMLVFQARDDEAAVWDEAFIDAYAGALVSLTDRVSHVGVSIETVSSCFCSSRGLTPFLLRDPVSGPLDKQDLTKGFLTFTSLEHPKVSPGVGSRLLRMEPNRQLRKATHVPRVVASSFLAKPRPWNLGSTRNGTPPLSTPSMRSI
jgi:hypothetical protein